MTAAPALRGWYGWAGIAAVVTIADIWAVKKGLETMTAAYRACPRWVSLPATAIVVAHLLGIIPEQADPFERIGALFTPKQVVEAALRATQGVSDALTSDS